MIFWTFHYAWHRPRTQDWFKFYPGKGEYHTIIWLSMSMSQPTSSRFNRGLKLFSVQGLVLLLGILVLELSFGYWFSGVELGNIPLLRDYDYSFDVSDLYSREEPVRYRRDHFGLRGDFDNYAEIDILTLGGSTTDQRYVPLESTFQEVMERDLSLAGQQAIVDGCNFQRNHFRRVVGIFGKDVCSPGSFVFPKIAFFLNHYRFSVSATPLLIGTTVSTNPFIVMFCCKSSWLLLSLLYNTRMALFVIDVDRSSWQTADQWVQCWRQHPENILFRHNIWPET